MISLKNAEDLKQMREACRLSAAALKTAQPLMVAGVNTMEIERAVRRFITQSGGTPSFLNYAGYPAACCISVNDQVIHGIPSTRTVLRDGDVVSVDVGVKYGGFHGDNAFTFRVGQVSDEAEALLTVTQECLRLGIAQAKPGNRVGDISKAVEDYARAHGYGVVTRYVGHGIGRNLHEDPEVPNFVGKGGRGVRLVPGMTLAIEPMINLRGDEVKDLSDGWTVVTASGSISAHFEHTVLITAAGAEILTVC